MTQYSTLPSLTTAQSRAVPSPVIDRYQCRSCGSSSLGQPLLQPQHCPSCGAGRLVHVGTWDLRSQAWPHVWGEGQA
jgi:predicted Zn-ribbon and HTH transcriptional regulator